jgi:hypothetical protein
VPFWKELTGDGESLMWPPGQKRGAATMTPSAGSSRWGARPPDEVTPISTGRRGVEGVEMGGRGGGRGVMMGGGAGWAGGVRVVRMGARSAATLHLAPISRGREMHKMGKMQGRKMHKIDKMGEVPPFRASRGFRNSILTSHFGHSKITAVEAGVAQR